VSVALPLSVSVYAPLSRLCAMNPRLPATLPTLRPLCGELILARCRREPTGEHDDGRATAAFKRRLNAITLLLIERSRLRQRLEACRAKQPPEPVEQHVFLPFDPGRTDQRRNGA